MQWIYFIPDQSFMNILHGYTNWCVYLSLHFFLKRVSKNIDLNVLNLNMTKTDFDESWDFNMKKIVSIEWERPSHISWKL